MKIYKRLSAMILCIVMVSVLLPIQAYAAGRIDLDQGVGLSISYQDDQKPLSGAEFQIYLVATVDQCGELTVTEDFAQLDVKIKDRDEDSWRTLASTLEGYVLRDNISSTDRGNTDDKGVVSFPTTGKELKMGLYLVLGQRHIQNGYRYDPVPFMVMLPELDQGNNEWIYDVTVNAKYDFSIIPDHPDDTGISRKVLKVWEDDGYEEDRPKEVMLQLLGDGNIYDTVTLNAENNWRYIWTNLDDRYTWTVVEKELEGYTVEVTREGITFVVTNTHEKNIPDDSTPTKPSTPDNPTTSSKSTLPQTGQLWWPVLVLVVTGLLFVVIGLIRRRGMTEEN